MSFSACLSPCALNGTAGQAGGRGLPRGGDRAPQYQRGSPSGRFLKRFMLHMYWLGQRRT